MGSLKENGSTLIRKALGSGKEASAEGLVCTCAL